MPAALAVLAPALAASPPAWGATGTEGFGWHFNWIWLVELTAFLVAGVGVTFWLNGNAEKAKMNRDIWIPSMLGALLVPVACLVLLGEPGIWLYLLGHTFPVGVFIAYAKAHDPLVPERDQLLTAAKFNQTMRNTLLRLGIRLKAAPEYSTTGVAIEGLALMAPDRKPLEYAHRAAGIKGDQLLQAQQLLVTFGESRVEQASIEAKGSQVVFSVLRQRRVSEFMKMPVEQGLPIARYFSALLGGGDMLNKGQVGGMLLKMPHEEHPLPVRGRQREHSETAFRLDMVFQHEPLPPPGIDEFELFPTVHETLQKLMRHDRGLVIVSGPPRQGVTTTYFAVLGMVDALIRDMLVYEIEDGPKVDHARHENVAGLDAQTMHELLQQTAVTGCDVAGFAAVLTHPKVDPKRMVAMVMEQAAHHITVIRVEAADSALAIARLVEHGADPQQLSKLLLAVVNQRLVGKLCDLCKAQVKIDPRALQRIGLPPNAPVKFYKSAGCMGCLQSGYNGLTPVLEVLVNNSSTRTPIAQGASADELRKAAWQGGSLMFTDSVILKAALGSASVTDLSKAVAPGAPAKGR